MGETRSCSLCFIVVNGRLYTNTIHQIHVTDIIDRTHGVTFLTGLVGFGWLRIPIERMVVHEECTLHLCLVLNGVKICCRLVTECINMSDLVLCQYLYLEQWHILPVNTIRIILHIQTILQYFYKLLMWQILTSSNMGSLLTSYFYL